MAMIYFITKSDRIICQKETEIGIDLQTIFQYFIIC